jgi:hypothetical protein
MDDYTWNTDYAHSDNTETMCDYLDNHLPEGAEVLYHDGTYAEILYNYAKHEVHASGDGDFTHHRVSFKSVLDV